MHLMDQTRPIQTPKQSLGERLKARRVELSISQSELSRNTGISQTMISALEKSVKHRVHALLELSYGLETSVEWLVLGYGNRDASRSCRCKLESEVEFLYLFRRQISSLQKKVTKLLGN